MPAECNVIMVRDITGSHYISLRELWPTALKPLATTPLSPSSQPSPTPKQPPAHSPAYTSLPCAGARSATGAGSAKSVMGDEHRDPPLVRRGVGLRGRRLVVVQPHVVPRPVGHLAVDGGLAAARLGAQPLPAALGQQEPEDGPQPKGAEPKGSEQVRESMGAWHTDLRGVCGDCVV